MKARATDAGLFDGFVFLLESHINYLKNKINVYKVHLNQEIDASNVKLNIHNLF